MSSPSQMNSKMPVLPKAVESSPATFPALVPVAFSESTTSSRGTVSSSLDSAAEERLRHLSETRAELVARVFRIKVFCSVQLFAASVLLFSVGGVNTSNGTVLWCLFGIGLLLFSFALMTWFMLVAQATEVLHRLSGKERNEERSVQLPGCCYGIPEKSRTNFFRWACALTHVLGGLLSVLAAVVSIFELSTQKSVFGEKDGGSTSQSQSGVAGHHPKLTAPRQGNGADSQAVPEWPWLVLGILGALPCLISSLLLLVQGVQFHGAIVGACRQSSRRVPHPTCNEASSRTSSSPASLPDDLVDSGASPAGLSSEGIRVQPTALCPTTARHQSRATCVPSASRSSRSDTGAGQSFDSAATTTRLVLAAHPPPEDTEYS